jgi:hypothetical protein
MVVTDGTKWLYDRVGLILDVDELLDAFGLMYACLYCLKPC